MNKVTIKPGTWFTVACIGFGFAVACIEAGVKAYVNDDKWDKALAAEPTVQETPADDGV